MLFESCGFRSHVCSIDDDALRLLETDPFDLAFQNLHEKQKPRMASGMGLSSGTVIQIFHCVS